MQKARIVFLMASTLIPWLCDTSGAQIPWNQQAVNPPAVWHRIALSRNSTKGVWEMRRGPAIYTPSLFGTHQFQKAQLVHVLPSTDLTQLFLRHGFEISHWNKTHHLPITNYHGRFDRVMQRTEQEGLRISDRVYILRGQPLLREMGPGSYFPDKAFHQWVFWSSDGKLYLHEEFLKSLAHQANPLQIMSPKSSDPIDQDAFCRGLLIAFLHDLGYEWPRYQAALHSTSADMERWHEEAKAHGFLLSSPLTTPELFQHFHAAQLTQHITEHPRWREPGTFLRIFFKPYPLLRWGSASGRALEEEALPDELRQAFAMFGIRKQPLFFAGKPASEKLLREAFGGLIFKHTPNRHPSRSPVKPTPVVQEDRREPAKETPIAPILPLTNITRAQKGTSLYTAETLHSALHWWAFAWGYKTYAYTAPGDLENLQKTLGPADVTGFASQVIADLLKDQGYLQKEKTGRGNRFSYRLTPAALAYVEEQCPLWIHRGHLSSFRITERVLYKEELWKVSRLRVSFDEGEPSWIELSQGTTKIHLEGKNILQIKKTSPAGSGKPQF